MVEVYCSLHLMLYGCRCSHTCNKIVGTIMCICFRYFGFGKSAGFVVLFSFLSTLLSGLPYLHLCCLPTAVSGKSSCSVFKCWASSACLPIWDQFRLKLENIALQLIDEFFEWVMRFATP